MPNVRVPGAIIYTRVSTGEQAEHGTSLAGQRDACLAKAAALSLPVIAHYEDAGVSGGFLLTRQGMQSALADIEVGRADTLICAKLDRYSRDVEHQQAIKRAVRNAGGRLVFCDMDFEDTPEGDLSFTIHGGFAAYEKAAIKKRTYGGRVRLAKAGIQTSRVYSPFGYHVVGTADVLRGMYAAEERGTYQVIDTEAEIVRDMFSRYASGAASLTSLARWLTESGIRTRTGGARWHPSAVRYILSNPVYKGLAAFGKSDHFQDENRVGQIKPETGKKITNSRVSRPAAPETWITWEVPALVPEATWDRVQAKFGDNKREHGGNPGRVRILAGRVFCSHCGAPMHVMFAPQRKGPHKESYLCSSYRKKLSDTKEQGCQPTFYPLSITEEAVTRSFLEAAANSEAVKVALAVKARQIDPMQDDAGRVRKRIAKDRAELDARQKATVEAQIAGVLAGADPAAYAAVFGQIAEARTALNVEEAHLPTERRRNAAPPAARTTEQDAAAALSDAALVLASPDVSNATKRKIIGRIVAAVYPIEERKPYQREGGWGARVEFLPEAFGDMAPAAGGSDYVSETFHSMEEN